MIYRNQYANATNFIKENGFENIICKMVTILPRLQYVTSLQHCCHLGSGRIEWTIQQMSLYSNSNGTGIMWIHTWNFAISNKIFPLSLAIIDIFQVTAVNCLMWHIVQTTNTRTVVTLSKYLIREIMSAFIQFEHDNIHLFTLSFSNWMFYFMKSTYFLL